MRGRETNVASGETCYENGSRQYNAKNYPEAVKWYRQGAQKGHAQCQNMLGICYYRGHGETQNYPEAVRWFTAAAKQGEANAQNSLGNCYYNGLGVTRDYGEAVKWYQAAAQQGDHWAQYNLGNCYYNGQGVARNFAEAVRQYRASASQGNVNAQNVLGNCYYNGQGVAQNYAEAVKWYQAAIRQGYHWAQYNLGNCYYYGNGVARDYAEAVRLYTEAANQGNANAQNALGNCYYNGNGVTQSYTEAVKWYQAAVRQGHHWAQYNLANCYYNGRGVPQNYTEAVKLYEAAAHQSNAEAQNALANCYYNGRGVTQNYTEAVKWYTEAAERGNYAWAQNNLANCYYNGQGVTQNYAKAVKWYMEAANQGNTEAMNNLGNCYYHGKGATRDYTQAVKWYEKAAQAGHAWAQCNLAYCYRYGYGVAENIQEAIRFYTLSAKQGNQTAKDALDAINGDSGDTRKPKIPADPKISADPKKPSGSKEPKKSGQTKKSPPESRESASLEDLLAQLERMTGLVGVKQQVKTQVAQIRVEQMAREKGLTVARTDAPSRHMVFTGNPGTGKTTVARLIGKIYGALGVLPNGDVFVECSRKDLVAEYIGQTAGRVQKKVEEARGGILFIDEAYSLFREEDPRDFGQEAIDTLIQCMENERDSLIVILAGYTKQMHHMLQKANPGLKSRIRTEIRFEDYSASELLSIFESMLERQGKCLAPDAREEARDLLEKKVRDPDFGNARGVRNLTETVLEKLQLRLAAMSDFSEEDYATILAEDVRSAADAGKASSRKTVQELMAELDDMVGLANVKKEVRKRVAAIQVAEMAKKAGAANSAGVVSPHMVFTGNPGTGKTTVARLLGQIYGALGVLPSGNVFVECSRADLVGTHVGETAPMVQERVREAMGGILFIDEAYSLYREDSGNDYGQEAIDTLIQCMENNRGSLVVILAGYTDEMRQMLRNANPGLRSRIGTEIEFEDYTVPELCRIFRSMLSRKNLRLKEDVEDGLVTELFTLCEEDPDFGNARGVRNIMDQVVDARNARLYEKSVAGGALAREDFETISAQDVRTVLDFIRTKPKKKPEHHHIGF
jgi:TPR repeat protein/AAA+ superfamily predicted ATPase